MKSKAICILGMHRSGTSTITRAINLIGAYLGEKNDFHPPSPYNPQGYWERKDIINLHERILHQLGKTWDTTLPLPDGWYLSREIQPFKEELVELIRKKFSDHLLWAWKDPRTTILLPLWKDVLDRLGIDLSSVFMVRNPLDVAKSLEKRDHLTHDKSFGFWFNNNISALRTILHIPHIFISYDRFINNWESELKKCAARLGISWPDDDSRLKEKMTEFIRPDLRHSVSEMKDLKESDVPHPVVYLYGLLEEAVEKSIIPDGVFLTTVERLWNEFSSYAWFFQYDVSRLEQVVTNKDRRLAERDRQLAECDRKLEKQERQIQALLNTYSWKITAPLRWILNFFKEVVIKIKIK